MELPVPDNTLARRLRQFGLILLAWTAAGLFLVSQDLAVRLYRTDPTPWQHVVANWMAGMYVSALLTPALLWLGNRWPLERNKLRHVLFAVLFAAVEIAVEAPILLAMGTLSATLSRLPFLSLFGILAVYTFHGNVIRYLIVVGIQAGWRVYRRYQARERDALRLQMEAAQLTAQLTGAQLHALKMQLHPHFLFNTLGAIMVLVRQRQTGQAEQMLGKLSDLLRRVLEDSAEQEVPLSRELEYLRLYLDIEAVRFPDRLRVRIAAEPDALDALVPHMALQPIVENAIRHGLGPSAGMVTIEIGARAADVLTLTVADDGPGLQAEAQPGSGIGLANTRARLRSLYGDLAGLTVENRTPTGVQATMTLPLRMEAA